MFIRLMKFIANKNSTKIEPLFTSRQMTQTHAYKRPQQPRYLLNTILKKLTPDNGYTAIYFFTSKIGYLKVNAALFMCVSILLYSNKNLMANMVGSDDLGNENLGNPAHTKACNTLATRISRPAKKTIDTKDYYYHSIGPFNLVTLLSILNHGILSKKTADEKGIYTNSSGSAWNGKSNVSISTSDVLNCPADYASYAGADISIIISRIGVRAFDPNKDDGRGPVSMWKPLTIPGVYDPNEYEDSDSEHQLDHELQVKGQIYTTSFIGIMIPDVCLEKDLSENTVVGIYDLEGLKKNMLDLDKFFQNEFSCSMLENAKIKYHYNEALNLKNEECDPFFKKENEVSKNLNVHIMLFISDLYKCRLGLDNITITDVIYYHTQDKYPLYNSKGNIIIPDYAQNKLSSTQVSLFNPNKSNSNVNEVPITPDRLRRKF